MANGRTDQEKGDPCVAVEETSIPEFRGGMAGQFSVGHFIATEGRMSILDNAGAVAALAKAWRQFGNWRVGRWVVMPDHVHFFCAPAVFPTPDLQRWLSAVKSWTSREFPPELKERVFSRAKGRKRIFQMHAWDTQIRSGAHYSEKWEYTLRNPVRKGFVARWEDWPWQGEENRLDWHD